MKCREFLDKFDIQLEDDELLDLNQLPGRFALKGETIQPQVLRYVNRRTKENRC